MATEDPTWDDTGFDDDPSEGFLAEEPKKADPKVEEPVATVLQPPVPPPEKKQRGALFWFGTLAALVLLIAVIGGGIYWLTLPSAEEEAFFAKEANVPSAVTDSAVTVPPTEELAVVDTTIVHDPEALEALFGDSAANEAPAPTADVKPTPKANAQQTPKANVQPTPKADAKPTTKSNVQPTPKADAKQTTKSNVQQTTKSSAQLFVVQVFSSPSRDDAEEWLQSLRSKNVADAYITEQKIKGESWYRVRFGQFSTRDAAEAEALRLGFREPWVARIR